MKSETSSDQCSKAHKPNYAVPLMSDIREIEWNGYNVVSTFAGCGGSSTGYRMAGFRVLWANEFIEIARDTYALNCSDRTVIDGRDIRDIKSAEIKSAIGGARIDVLDGSPPCSSFSTAGKVDKGWGKQTQYSGTKQRTDDLFFEFARILNELQPRAFVAENVAGLIKGKSKGYFKEIFRALSDCGYNVKVKLLDAQWLGVPQMRRRLIFIGTRNDLELMPEHPSPLPYRYTIADVLPSVAKRGAAVDYHVEDKTDLEGYAHGIEYDRLRIGESSKLMFELIRANPHRPVPCITATGGYGAAPVHPYERRRFAIHELKLLCGFPSDFELTGAYKEQWERLGRSVPPVMMSKIAAKVAQTLSAAR